MSVKSFISYANEDKNKMKALSMALKKYKLDIIPIVVAKMKTPLKPLSDKVKQGISKSDIFIPIITKISIKNQWVNQEIGYATAKGLTILPIIDENILKQLTGFLHPQIDLSFSFKSNKKDIGKESKSFRECYKILLEHIKSKIIEIYFWSDIKPKKVKQGESYTTKIKFKGIIRNGFFDNFVKHLESDWQTWNWDKGTLKNSRHTTPGNLHGKVDIKQHVYTWKTTKWPKGNYKIYTRLYDHLTTGVRGRKKLAEDIHNFVVE